MRQRQIGAARRAHGPRSLKRLAAAGFLGCCMACLLGASPAAAQGLLDANCPGPGNKQVTPPGNTRRAETFSAQRTGTLVRGELVVNKDSGSSGDYVMQIYPTDPTGLPINAVLASATIANASVPDGISTITGTFDPPLGVVAGKGYALSLYRSASFPALRDWDTDPCPGTEAGSGSLSGPWEIDVGPNGPTFDLVFAVFVKPSNAFTLGRLERNKKKGTATLTANVPYPGELTASGNGVSAAVFSKTVGAPGDVHLLIKAKGKKKKNLNRKGKVKVNLAITYTPTGGDPSSQSIKVKLKKKLKKL